MDWFIVYTKSMSFKWPLELYRTDAPDEERLTSLEEIKRHLINESKIYYRDVNKHEENVRKALYKSQVLTIIGPIDVREKREVPLSEVLTLHEAVEEWMNISKVDTIRKAILSGRFYDYEVRKSSNIWLVTRSGMMRLFGPPDEMKYPSLVVNQIVFNNGNPYLEPKL